ncbi:hypothetical protein [Cupriavidus pauculus]|jgi:hypothetical protein|uniref:hypothetical protein n=1 Tax=Cupriavidus pauculus TaxID=82633 RepID=UPI0030FD0424
MPSFLDAVHKRFTRRRLVAVSTAAIVLAGLLPLLRPEYLKFDNVATPAGDVHFTFGVSDLYAPFLTPAENLDVLTGLTAGAKVSATYRHTTYSFHLLTCEVGVGCWPGPHWQPHSTEQFREFPVKFAPPTGEPHTISVDMPQSLDGGYSLAKLYITLSSDAFYRQPSYDALVKKTARNLSSLDLDPPPPSFEYLVHFTRVDHSVTQADTQDCLFVSTPFGFPEIKIPIVTRVISDSKRISLQQLMHSTCPQVDIDFGNTPGIVSGRLPPSRIAVAQTKIELDNTDGTTRLYGTLPVSAEMTRWFHRNDEGVRAYIMEFGPFRQLEMRVLGDTAHAVDGTLPNRLETWTFYDNMLVGYTVDIMYDIPEGRTEEMPEVHLENYFLGGKSVWMHSESTHCDDPGCIDALAEITNVMSLPYDALLAEAHRYLELRGVLQPFK